MAIQNKIIFIVIVLIFIIGILISISFYNTHTPTPTRGLIWNIVTFIEKIKKQIKEAFIKEQLDLELKTKTAICASESKSYNRQTDSCQNTEKKCGINVSCIGDSSTEGYPLKNWQNYVYQLQKILGSGYNVSNFGISATTILLNGDGPYMKNQLYQNVLKSKPDIVTIMLGTNDTKPQNWKYKDNFINDYSSLVRSFLNLSPPPKVFLCLPPPSPDLHVVGIKQQSILEEIPLIKQVAEQNGCYIIDTHTPLLPFRGNTKAFSSDLIHPNEYGASIIAKTIADAIKTLYNP